MHDISSDAICIPYHNQPNDEDPAHRNLSPLRKALFISPFISPNRVSLVSFSIRVCLFPCDLAVPYCFTVTTLHHANRLSSKLISDSSIRNGRVQLLFSTRSELRQGFHNFGVGGTNWGRQRGLPLAVAICGYFLSQFTNALAQTVAKRQHYSKSVIVQWRL